MTNPICRIALALEVSTTVLVVSPFAHGQTTATPARDPVEDPEKQAAAAFWQGKARYDQGDFAAARERFEQAYGLIRDPELLYDIAQSYRQEPNCEPSKRTYRQFLELSPDSPHAAMAQLHIAALEGQCPTPVAQQASMPSGELSGATTATNSTAPVAAPPAPAQPMLKGQPLSSSAKSNEDPTRRWLVTSTLVAGAVAGTAALAVGIWNERRHALWKERDRDLAQGQSSNGSAADWAARQHSNDELSNEIHQTGKVVLYLGIGAGAAWAASAALFLTRSERVTTPTNGDASRVAWTCPVTVGTKALYCTVSSSF